MLKGMGRKEVSCFWEQKPWDLVLFTLGLAEWMDLAAWPGPCSISSFGVVVLRKVCVFLLVFRRLWVLLSHRCWVYKGYRPTPNICRVQGKKALGPQAPLLSPPSTVKPLCALWHSTSIACPTPPPSTTPANSHPQPPLTSQGTETQQCGPPSGGWTRKGPWRPRR